MRLAGIIALALVGACGKSESSKAASQSSFRQMHEAAVASRDKGLSLEAAARPFVGSPVELDVIAGEMQNGICSTCFEMTYEDIKVLVVPDRDLDPIKFALFVEKHAGQRVHVRAVVNGGAPGFSTRSPLALRILAIETSTTPAPASASPRPPPNVTTAHAASTDRTGSAATAASARALVIQPETQPTQLSAPVELLHSLGGVVTVSSTVANNAHRPEHLTDGDLSTAWNSRTGALAGTWISIDLPTSTRLTAFKMTAGFTASGPNGDDWFTMNHRVTRIRLLVDQKEIGEFKLDPDVRDLQSVALDTEGKSIRMEILGVSTGSKKNWKEACISEVELWGRASGPAKGGKVSPRVRVDDGRPCPDKARLVQLVRARSTKKGEVVLNRCMAGRFARGSWYVTAAVNTKPPTNDPFAYGDRFLVRGVLDKGGKFAVFQEEGDSANHPSWWTAIELRDRSGDGFDDAVEDIERAGGVRRLDRDVLVITDAEIKRISSEPLGEYVDGILVPEKK